jgi:hypothetical protein
MTPGRPAPEFYQNGLKRRTYSEALHDGTPRP